MPAPLPFHPGIHLAGLPSWVAEAAGADGFGEVWQGCEAFEDVATRLADACGDAFGIEPRGAGGAGGGDEGVQAFDDGVGLGGHG